jgi:16S rRNA C1402 (ribose-2'-O) methylase RsmI
LKVTTQPNERTKVLYNSEKIIKETLKSLADTKEKIDLCADVTGPSIHVTTQPVWRAFIELYNRSIKFRFITEVAKENLSYCEEIMKIADNSSTLSMASMTYHVTPGRFFSAFCWRFSSRFLISSDFFSIKRSKLS